jgi:hypothetical protein
MDVQLSDFVTIALLVLLEGLLSADNALVLAILVLGLPRSQQQAPNAPAQASSTCRPPVSTMPVGYRSRPSCGRCLQRVGPAKRCVRSTAFTCSSSVLVSAFGTAPKSIGATRIP